MSNIVCGVDPNNYKGRCEEGVSLNSELCSYNEKTKNCNKKSKKTWAQIEKDLKEIKIPIQAVSVVAKEIEKQQPEIKKKREKPKKSSEPLEEDIENYSISLFDNQISIIKDMHKPTSQINTIPINIWKNITTESDEDDPCYISLLIDCGNNFYFRVSSTGIIDLSYAGDFTIFYQKIPTNVTKRLIELILEKQQSA